MIVAFMGAIILAAGFLFFCFGLRQQIIVTRAAFLILVGVAAEIVDPIYIVQLGKIIIKLPWLG
jgi:hypothetical protein